MKRFLKFLAYHLGLDDSHLKECIKKVYFGGDSDHRKFSEGYYELLRQERQITRDLKNRLAMTEASLFQREEQIRGMMEQIDKATVVGTGLKFRKMAHAKATPVTATYTTLREAIE